MTQTPSENELPFVIITHTLPEGWLTFLRGACRMLTGPIDAVRLEPDLAQRLPDAEGIISLLTIPINEAVLEKAPKLRVVSNMAVGVDNIDLDACTRRGIPVGNTPGVLTDSTADLAFALLLSAARLLSEASLDAREGRWRTWSPAGWLGADLHGAKLGIIGMGKIGQAVARRAIPFGMEILYTDSTPCGQAERELGAVCLPLNEILERSDFVSIHTPLTPQTKGMIDSTALKRMKPSAILINTARGPIVDMDALAQALKEGWICSAALDVTEPEPLPPEHPLFHLPNCLITPHIGSATRNTRQRMAELACQNLLAGLQGRRLPNCVNPQVYRS